MVNLKSCTALAADVNGSKVTTIEDYNKWKMHLCKRHLKMHGLQCGFAPWNGDECWIFKSKNPSDEEIRDWLKVIRRCG